MSFTLDSLPPFLMPKPLGSSGDEILIPLLPIRQARYFALDPAIVGINT